VTAVAPAPLRTRQLWGLAVAAALVPLNSTMIAVALPDVGADFDITTGSAGILVTSYLVVMLVGQPMMGRLVDAVGGRRALRWALAGFAAVSIATSLAPSFALVVAGRGVQAVFGAVLMPASHALLRSLTPADQRGRSFGLLGSFIGAGAAVGPVIGGVVTAAGGWQGIFLVNAPLCLAGYLLVAGLPRGVTRAGRASDGRGVVATLRQRTFASALVIQSTTTLAQYSLLLVVPIVLDGRGWSATATGLALTALTAGMVLLGPVGGRFGDEHGRRRPIVLGVGTAAITTVAAIAVVEHSTGGLVAAMAVFGFGLGFSLPSVQTVALESVPEELAGSAAGVLSMSRYAGSIPASLLLALLVTDQGNGARAYLAVAAVAMTVAFLAATSLPGQIASLDRPGARPIPGDVVEHT
jgi:MFS transporter, DHA2 family, methylenomycin A resistance protein